MILVYVNKVLNKIQQSEKKKKMKNQIDMKLILKCLEGIHNGKKRKFMKICLFIVIPLNF